MTQLKYIASIKKGIKDVGNVINKGVQKVWKIGKAVGKWVVEHIEDILKVVGTSLVIAGIAVASISMGGVAGMVLMGIASGAAIGGTVNGVINIKNGGNFANGLGTFVTEGLDMTMGGCYDE